MAEPRVTFVMWIVVATLSTTAWARTGCPENEQDNDGDGVCAIACTHAEACVAPFLCDDSSGEAECECDGEPVWLYGSSGEANRVLVRDGVALVAQGPGGLAVYDVSTPASPRHIGGIQVGGYAVNFSLYGDTLYLAAADAGLVIFDVSDMRHPELLGHYDTDGHVYAVKVLDGYAYMADGGEGLHIADVSNPAEPSFVYSSGSTSFAYDLVVVEETVGESVRTTVFLAEGELGIGRFNVTDPATAARTGRTDTYDNGTARELVLVGDILYLADSTAGLWIYRIVDNSPDFLGRYETENFVFGLDVVGNTAYLGAWADGVVLVDVTDPAAPQRLGGCATAGLPQDVFVDGDVAYVSDTSGGLVVLDVANQQNPAYLGRYHTLGWTYDIAKAGEHVFLADGRKGLAVFDVSQPRQARYLETLGERGAGRTLLQGDRMYVATDAGGTLDIWDVSELDAPSLINSFDAGSPVYDVAVEDGYAFLGVASWNLRVVDIRDPLDPIIVFSDYHQRGTTFNLLVEDGIGYLGKGWSGFEIKDFSDPANPVVIFDYDTPGWQRGLFLQGNTLYVADAEAGLLIWDVHDPANARQIGVYDTPGEVSAAYVVGALAYVADDAGGLLVLDVADPTSPVLVASHPTWDRANDVVVDGDTVYLSDTEGGLQIFDVEQCRCSPGTVMLDGVCESAAAPSSSGALVVTEFMARSSDYPRDLGEWVELYNPGDALFDLEGCVLRDDGGDTHTFGDLAVPVGAHVVVSRGAHMADTHGFIPDYIYDGFRLDDDGDEIVLECGDVEIDRVVYDSAQVAEGGAAKLSPGAYDATGNDNPANWCVDGSATFGEMGLRGTPQHMNLAACALAGGDSCEEGHECVSGLCADSVCCAVAECVHGRCDTLGNGTCDCDEGWLGSACAFTTCDGVPSDDPTVCNGRGSCTAPDICECDGHWTGASCDTCEDGWEGDDCQLTRCGGTLSDDPTVCSGRGVCIGPDGCDCSNHWVGDLCETCEEGWEGDDCQLTRCDGTLSDDPSVCNGHGACAGPDLCECAGHWDGVACDTCEDGWDGDDCERTYCDGVASTEIGTVCSGHGACVGPDTCECDLGWGGDLCVACAPGWAGDSCDVCDAGHWGPTCEPCPACVNGECNEGLEGDGICVCHEGWDGLLCDVPVCEPACDPNATCAAPQTCECHAGYVGDGLTCALECEGSADWALCSDGACFDGSCATLTENDTCELAIALVVDDEEAGSLDGAHAFLSLGSDCLEGGLTVPDGFYLLTIEVSGDYEVTLVPDTGVDLALAAWTGCGAEAVCLAAADDAGPGGVETFVVAADGDVVLQVLLVAGPTERAGFSISAQFHEEVVEAVDAGGAADIGRDVSSSDDTVPSPDDAAAPGELASGGGGGGGGGCHVGGTESPHGAWALLLLLLAIRLGLPRRRPRAVQA